MISSRFPIGVPTKYKPEMRAPCETETKLKLITGILDFFSIFEIAIMRLEGLLVLRRAGGMRRFEKWNRKQLG